MSARWEGQQTLLDPISADKPCGENLDDLPPMPDGTRPASPLVKLDTLRLFGQARSPEAPPDPEDREKESGKTRPPIDWDRIRADAVEALEKSKDLRLLAYLGTALLRTDGLPAFAATLATASQWLETYWTQVFPSLDEDAIARRNALNCFADPMAVVDRVWRLPLVASRQHGRFSLRDLDMASGQLAVGAKDTRPDEKAIDAAFKEMSLEEWTALDQGVTNGLAALASIDTKMRAAGGPEVAPDFDPLSTQFAKLNRLCREQLAARMGGTGVDVAAGAEADARSPGFAVGKITSRGDAIRALEAVADYFRGNEPSSPIPLIVDRAKRLVAKDFLEVLADIAPEAVATARSAGGLKDQQ